jgi:hypothetical protein
MSAVDGQGVAATVREHGRLTLPLPGCVSARRVRIARPPAHVRATGQTARPQRVQVRTWMQHLPQRA